MLILSGVGTESTDLFVVWGERMFGPRADNFFFSSPWTKKILILLNCGQKILTLSNLGTFQGAWEWLQEVLEEFWVESIHF